ncbi:hypothetical protein TNCV_5057251 [Trichonephila clavipes]|nr:hypothetical protein TNCV_5057251 [Trichonephila clavipes]
MKTVSVDKVRLCVSILNKDGLCRQGKVRRQHPNQRRCLQTRLTSGISFTGAQRLDLDWTDFGFYLFSVAGTTSGKYPEVILSGDGLMAWSS